jgi:hypothetical protein
VYTGINPLKGQINMRFTEGLISYLTEKNARFNFSNTNTLYKQNAALLEINLAVRIVTTAL